MGKVMPTGSEEEGRRSTPNQKEGEFLQRKIKVEEMEEDDEDDLGPLGSNQAEVKEETLSNGDGEGGEGSTIKRSLVGRSLKSSSVGYFPPDNSWYRAEGAGRPEFNLHVTVESPYDLKDDESLPRNHTLAKIYRNRNWRYSIRGNFARFSHDTRRRNVMAPWNNRVRIWPHGHRHNLQLYRGRAGQRPWRMMEVGRESIEQKEKESVNRIISWGALSILNNSVKPDVIPFKLHHEVKKHLQWECDVDRNGEFPTEKEKVLLQCYDKQALKDSGIKHLIEAFKTVLAKCVGYGYVPYSLIEWKMVEDYYRSSSEFVLPPNPPLVR